MPVTPVGPPTPSPTEILTIVKNIIVKIATLQKPVTAAAVAGFVLALIPGVGLTATEVSAVLVGVGVVAATVEEIV